MSAIHERISMHRKAAGLTQEQLGAKLGISGQAVSKWEKGDSLPDILLLPELCDIFGITTDDLLRDQPREVVNSEAKVDDDLRRALEASDGYRISPSMIQRKCSVGYGTASRWIERLREAGVIEQRDDSMFFYLTKEEKNNL